MEADLYEEINVMIQLYLIRHSMTAGNLKKRYIGRTDESLCPEGIVLLESYIQKNIYPEVQRVYVSPMKRCMETAKLIFKENFYEVEELRECDFGIFENKNYKELSDCRHDQIKSVAVVAHGGTIMSIMDRYARDENGQPDGSYYDYQVKNGEGYELIIADVSSGDGRICAGSDIWRSGVAVSSGENDRSFDLRGGKNYKKLIP